VQAVSRDLLAESIVRADAYAARADAYAAGYVASAASAVIDAERENQVDALIMLIKGWEQ
jgi:hypothetical protein